MGLMKSNIPNVLTCCNLISGCIATYFAFYGELPLALLMIIVGAVFDFLDGLTARALNVSCEIGKELDSLADCITFGVAPSAMLFWVLNTLNSPLSTLHSPLSTLHSYAAFLLAAFSALRLAKFNLDTRQTSSFIGLPTPACALFWASLTTSVGTQLGTIWYILLLLTFCYLLVSELPMFSFKFKHKAWNYGDNAVKYSYLILSALIILISILTAHFTLFVLTLLVALYILISINVFMLNRVKRIYIA